MNLKTKLAAGAIGMLALSGGAFAAMLPGTASAAPTHTPAVLTEATHNPSINSNTSTDSSTGVDTPEAISGADGPGGAQSGDQTSPDNATKGGEGASSEADGPGGHQDAGNTDTNHQFQGQE